MKPDEFLWVEKYRPQTIEECIIPQNIKTILNEMIAKGNIQNIMLTGSAGTGKTTIARALCHELELDSLIINCSENGNIDTLRTTIRSFASGMSFNDMPKCVILDEADGLTNATQQGLRNFIEEFSANCRFIFTANFSNKIIEPLKSRTVLIDMTLSKEDKIQVITQFDARVKEILKLESIEFEPHVLAQLIAKFFPDMRKTLNQLQSLTVNGSLDASNMKIISVNEVSELFAMLKARKFNDLRKWVAMNPNVDMAILGRMLYNACDEYVVFNSIPQLILHINKYQVNATMTADKEINLISFLTEIMVDLEYK